MSCFEFDQNSLLPSRFVLSDAIIIEVCFFIKIADVCRRVHRALSNTLISYLFFEFFTEIYVVEHTLYLRRRSLFFYFSWNSKTKTKKRVDRYYVRGTIGSHLISRQVSHSLIGPEFANVPRSSSPNSSAISRMLWLIPRARKKLAGARLLVAQWNGAFTEIVISRGKGPLSETSVSNLSTFSRCPRRVLVACHSLCRLDSQASQRAKQKTRNKRKKNWKEAEREKKEGRHDPGASERNTK